MCLSSLYCCGQVAGQDSAVSPNKAGTAGPQTDAAVLYTQSGTDPPFKALLHDKVIPVGHNSTGGVKGSGIDVNNALVERGANSTNAIPKDIRIHTVCNSVIPRKDFHKWTRWYQEDGNTQVFRLFRGEYNVRNDREYPGRVEAFSTLQWKRGAWHEWEGTYTIAKPYDCAIFQAKNRTHAWSVMINMTQDGNIILNHRRHQPDRVIARDMTKKSFHLRIRDNGHDYEVFLNGEKVGAGHFERPTDSTRFRWGMYPGERTGTTMKKDAMIFVTGAGFE